MATLQAAVSAVTGATWLPAAPSYPLAGQAWSDGGLRVVLSVAGSSSSLSAASVTAALAGVPGYRASAPTTERESIGGRDALVATWLPAVVVDGATQVVQVRRGTAAALAAENPVLAAGEVAWESDTGVERIGDGSTAYASLARRGSSTWAPLVEAVNAVAAGGAAQTIPDPSVQSVSRIVLTAACTLTFPTAVAGKSFTLVLVQGGTGSYTITWPAAAKWAGGTAPTLTTAVGAVDYLTFVCADGSTWAGFVAGLDVK